VPDAAPIPTGNLTQQAQRALERGQPGVAVDLARRAAMAAPGSAAAWLTLGAAYDASGNSGAARQAYRNCAQNVQGPSGDECRALLGNNP
jgi:Flp pilus assembly protein TadD